jgi:ribulose-phosphate 3-epimerase
MNNNWIAPSILSANFYKLGEEIESVINAGANIIHFDVMDNHYVPNLTIGPLVCKSISENIKDTPIDVHLMCEPVDNLIHQFSDAGASYITFHPEASNHVDRSLKLIQSKGIKSGLVLNPATPIDWLEYELDNIDMILLMSVNPGFAGQSFIESVLPKISKVKNLIKKSGKNIRLEVDGGINLNNIKQVKEAGADTFVMGSAIFNSENYSETIEKAFKLLNG